VKTNPVVVQRPSNFELTVGALIPDILKPGELAENTLPNKSQCVVIGGRTALIDPTTSNSEVEDAPGRHVMQPSHPICRDAM